MLSVRYTLLVRLSAVCWRETELVYILLDTDSHELSSDPYKAAPTTSDLMFSSLEARKLKAEAGNGRWNCNGLLWSR
jgi:hypothetical protein